jgi:hypothetical protein
MTDYAFGRRICRAVTPAAGIRNLSQLQTFGSLLARTCPTGNFRMHLMRELPVVPICRRYQRLRRRANHNDARASRLDEEGRFGRFCDQVHQLVVEPIDPMKSLQVAGWFGGELRAPT